MGLLGKAADKVWRRVNIYGRPSHLKVILENKLGVRAASRSNENHLRTAMEWLCLAQDVTKCGGVSTAYDLGRGWEEAYPETTGYIIPTFLAYADFSGDDSFVARAEKMGMWEIEIQEPNGAVRGLSGGHGHPTVFNTGQVILGWCALYQARRSTESLEAAKRAADWLIDVQDPDGKWSKFTHLSVTHSYHTRVAWPLLEVYRLTAEEKYKRACEKNILWALSKAHENGYFDHMGFRETEAPFTHTIAYTLRGLLESSVMLDVSLRERIEKTVHTAAENIMRCYELRKSGPYGLPKYLPGRLDSDWKTAASFSCLTGNLQLAIIWLKLYQLGGDARFLNAALKIIDQVKVCQRVRCGNMGIRGGIPGSFPIWGDYQAYRFPNWAAKFYADAIMLLESVMREIEGQVE